MRALVVGAGAVGHAYAWHLQRGGAEVGFLARPHQRDELLRGSRVYRLPTLGGPRRDTLLPHDVLTAIDQVAARPWDLVVLAVSTPALSGDWLPQLLSAVGDATVLTLQPGPPALLGALATPDDRVVKGLITLISYAAPLPTETRFDAPGWAWWTPPVGAAPLSGLASRAPPVAALLTAGGLRSRVVPDALALARAPTAWLQCAVLALEGAGWSFARARTDDHLRVCAAAIREQLAIEAATHGTPPHWTRHLAHPLALRTLLRAASSALPLPLEPYLHAHFAKVGAQTRELVRWAINAGFAHQMSTEAMTELARRAASQPPSEVG